MAMPPPPPRILVCFEVPVPEPLPLVFLDAFFFFTPPGAFLALLPPETFLVLLKPLRPPLNDLPGALACLGDSRSGYIGSSTGAA